MAARPGLVLLFYRKRERDKFVRFDRHLKPLLRPLFQKLHRRQKLSGFDVSFGLLVTSLRRRGVEVRINDEAYARQHPDHPVGLVGDTTLLEGWSLPNPALLGPSLYDHPLQAPRLMEDPRFRKYLVLADWMRAMFEPAYGDTLASWFAGIDINRWDDTRGLAKDIDVLVYDKIRWDRYVLVPGLLEKLREKIAARNLRIAELRYGLHDHATYENLLRRSRFMLFLCEHETQGLAYQEALASNVPVLAWDFGIWADPLWKLAGTSTIPASSVPFFSDACGETFQTLAGFDAALDRILEREVDYRPRAFVAAALSMDRSSEIYLREYFSLSAASSAG